MDDQTYQTLFGLSDTDKQKLVDKILEDYHNESLDNDPFYDENNELFDNEMYVPDIEEEA